jgi:hypothetical protein
MLKQSSLVRQVTSPDPKGRVQGDSSDDGAESQNKVQEFSLTLIGLQSREFEEAYRTPPMPFVETGIRFVTARELLRKETSVLKGKRNKKLKALERRLKTVTDAEQIAKIKKKIAQANEYFNDSEAHRSVSERKELVVPSAVVSAAKLLGLTLCPAGAAFSCLHHFKTENHPLSILFCEHPKSQHSHFFDEPVQLVVENLNGSVYVEAPARGVSYMVPIDLPIAFISKSR